MKDRLPNHPTHLSVEVALEVVLEEARRLQSRLRLDAPEPVPISRASGRALAHPVVAAEDDPRFDRSAMDGYAVRHADLIEKSSVLKVVGEAAAGVPCSASVGPGECVAIMTGAKIPAGADTVVILENTQIQGKNIVVTDVPRLGSNIRRRGENIRLGETALSAGSLINEMAVGLMASMGELQPSVFRRPRISVLASGSELVGADTIPGDGQIRESNGFVLAAMASSNGADVVQVSRVSDDMSRLRASVKEALLSDVAILSGGVSAGAYDLVGAALEAEGARVLFHKVTMKPGKPLLVAVKGDCLVFGLPGNPVSSFVTAALFVTPALRLLAGRAPGPFTMRATLQARIGETGARTTFHPARLQPSPGGHWAATPLPWRGSADQHAFARANCLVRTPAQAPTLEPGGVVEVICPQPPFVP